VAFACEVAKSIPKYAFLILWKVTEIVRTRTSWLMAGIDVEKNVLTRDLLLFPYSETNAFIIQILNVSLSMYNTLACINNIDEMVSTERVAAIEGYMRNTGVYLQERFQALHKSVDYQSKEVDAYLDEAFSDVKKLLDDLYEKMKAVNYEVKKELDDETEDVKSYVIQASDRMNDRMNGLSDKMNTLSKKLTEEVEDVEKKLDIITKLIPVDFDVQVAILSRAKGSFVCVTTNNGVVVKPTTFEISGVSDAGNLLPLSASEYLKKDLGREGLVITLQRGIMNQTTAFVVLTAYKTMEKTVLVSFG